MLACRPAIPHHRSPGFSDLAAKKTTIDIRPFPMVIRPEEGLLQLFRQRRKQAGWSGPLPPGHESTIGCPHVAVTARTVEIAKGLGLGLPPPVPSVDPDRAHTRRQPPAEPQQRDGKADRDGRSSAAVDRRGRECGDGELQP